MLRRLRATQARCAAIRRVRNVQPVWRVRIETTIDGVVPCTRADRVGTFTTDDRVVAEGRGDLVRVDACIDHVVARTAHDGIGIIPGGDGVGAVVRPCRPRSHPAGR